MIGVLAGMVILVSVTYLFNPGIIRYGFCYILNHFRECKEYEQQEYSHHLKDQLKDYISISRSLGIEPCLNETELQERVSIGEIFPVHKSNSYVIDKMHYSYPYLTDASIRLLKEIEAGFVEKTSEMIELKGIKIIITSMTRTKEQLEKLRIRNRNASKNSPHLNGNAFDITYVRFKSHKLCLSHCDKKYLKEALADVIWQLRREQKCWATYERKQHCFHVVAR